MQRRISSQRSYFDGLFYRPKLANQDQALIEAARYDKEGVIDSVESLLRLNIKEG